MLVVAACCLVASVAANPVAVVVPPSDRAIGWSGRSLVHADGSRSFDWAAQTLTVAVRGTTNLSILINESKTNRYAVYEYALGADGAVDYGMRKALVTTNSSTNSSWNGQASTRYALLTKLDPNVTHNILLFKTTEAIGVWMPFGPGHFQGLVLDEGGTAAAAPPPWLVGRRLEIYGDSITACFGCTGSVRFEPGCDGVQKEDAWFSWGSVLARNLQAEHHLQAWSAIGLLHDATPFSPGVMATMVGRTLGGEPDSPVNTTPGTLNAWDFASFAPSAVVSEYLSLPILRGLMPAGHLEKPAPGLSPEL